MKKFWILCLSLWVLCGTFVCFAAEETLATSGTCGETVTWKIFSSSYEDEYGDVIYEKTLVISGEGAMYDYSETDRPTWVTLGDGLSEYMKEIVIEDGVTHIGSHAFTGMTAETIHIGADVESIGKNAFCEIYGAYQVIVSEENTAYKDVAGVLFDKAGETLLYYPSDRLFSTYTVPEGVKTIGAKAFMGATRLKNIRLPLSLQSIEADAFLGCDRLANLRITGGSDALWAQVAIADGNDALSLAAKTYAPVVKASGSFGEALTWTFDDFGVLTIAGVGAMPDFESKTEAPWYAHAGSVYELVVEDGVTSIGNNAFDNFYFMYTAEIGNGVKSIGYRAFRACNTMYEITFGDSLETIEEQAFIRCYKLAHAKLPNSLKAIGVQAFESCSALLSVHIPDSTTAIGEKAFYGCENIRTAEVGSGVTVIENGVFALCSRMESLTLKGDITSIGMSAFSYCESLKSIVLPESLQTIGEAAFSFCEDLEKIVIPEGITVLKDRTFYYCTGLKQVTMADTVTEIGDSTFRQCFNLKEIVLPENLTTIGRETFFVCESLQTVHIPQNVVNIGKSAFASCFRLEEITVAEENEKYASIDCVLYDKEITTLLCCPAGIEKSIFTIPSSVVTIGENACKGCEGLESIIIPESVSTIGSSAFHSATALKSITIPDSVTAMGDGLFSHCTALETVKLPKNLTRIGVGMFAQCTALQTYTIPEGIESIGEEAFASCENLTSVTIPKSVTTIEEYAFLDCSSLTDIYYDGSSADWVMVDITSHNDELNAATMHYAIESGTCGENLVWTLTQDGVLTISGTGDMATWTTNEDIPWQDKKEQITEIYVEEGVTSISDGAFAFCAEATKVRMPSGLQSIGASAFSFCTALTDVILPSEGLVSIGDYAFRASGVTRLDFNDGLESIGSLAFAECTQLKYVDLPKSLHSYSLINPFYGCTSLEQILPAMGTTGVCTDGDALYTYDGTILLCYPAAQNGDIFGTDEDWGLTAIGLGAFSYANNLKKVYLPDGVAQIANAAFSHCAALTSIAIPATMQSIDQGAFVDCENLTEILFGGSEEEWNAIVIGDDNECLKNATVYYNTLDRGYVGENILWTYTTDGKMTISGTGEMIFEPYEEVKYWRYAQEATALEIQSGITTIADVAFDDFNKITELTIPEGVVHIGRSAFMDCRKLTKIQLPNSLKTIGNHAFDTCFRLENITIPDSVESIGDFAFWQCSAAKTLHIGKGVTSIGAGAFGLSKQLETFTIDEANTAYCIEDGVLYTKDKKELVFYMMNKTGVCTVPNGVVSIAPYAFSMHEGLTGVILPETLTSLGNNAFEYCFGIEKIIIPDSVTQIHEKAFQYCENLVSVVMGSGVKLMEEDVFGFCKNLRNIYYKGTPSAWNQIDIQKGHYILSHVTIHYAKTFSVTETVQENEAVTVTVLLEEKPEEGVVMLASYDKDGRFIGFDKQEISEEDTATLSVTVAEGGTYKTMLWQAVGALMPLSAAE